MPAYVVHALFGDDLLKELPVWTQKVVKENFLSYSWGLQGPDILFFRGVSKGGSSLNRLGRRLHTERTDQLFRAMAQYCQSRRGERDEGAVLSYFIGFIGHYAVDTICHPYVYWLQHRMGKSLAPHQVRMLHHRIEGGMDSTLYRIRNFRSVRSFDYEHRFSTQDAVTAPIALLYSWVIQTVYGDRVTPGEVSMALREANFYFKCMIDPTAGVITGMVEMGEFLAGRPGQISSFLKRDVGFDVLNLDHRRWWNLQKPEEVCEFSVLNLLCQSQELAKELAVQAVEDIESGAVYEPEGLEGFDNGSPKPSRRQER